MRTFGTGFTTKLSASSYLPVVFVKYELITYVSGSTAGTGTQTTTNYYWSERDITYSAQAYEARIVNTSPLNQAMDASNQVFGEMGLQISNSPTNLAGVIQAGMKCTVYLGFEDSAGSGTVTDAEVIYIGIVEGDIEITEDSVSFNLQDIANIYDKQLPELITREEYPYADPDSIGDTKSIIMGRNRDIECRAVASGFASVLERDSYGRSWGTPDANGNPVIALEGNKYIHVIDDIGWWKDAIGIGTYPEMTINTVKWFVTGETLYGQCSKGGYSQDDQTACEADGGTWYSANEVIQPIDVEFDASANLWKIILQEPLKIDHAMGDTVYESGTLCATTNEGYAYLVADHAVESITNVKVDGMPVSAQVITDHQTPLVCSDWNLPTGKAYVIVPTNAGGIGKQGSGAIEIQDTIEVSDTIDVDDAIDVDEPGHEHDTGGVQYYEHTLSWNFHKWAVGSYTGYIKIYSGSFSTTIADWESSPAPGVLVRSPLTFTSNSEKVKFEYKMASTLIGDYAAGFSYITVQGRRVDSTGAVSTAVSSVANQKNVLGSILMMYPVGIGGSPTTNVKADVIKTGFATKTGDAVKTGTVKLIGGNSAADVLVGQKVTCDVIGICDGTSGYVTPHNQIKKLINLYARNPLVGTEGSADIVEFVNESVMDTAFDKVYNTDSASNSGASKYPLLNIKSNEVINPSPTADLSNQDTTEGFHALDFAITEPNRLRDVVGDMLFHSNSTINWQNGIAQIKHNADTPTKDGDIAEADIVMQSMSLARSRASDLATDVVVRYDYSPTKDFARRFDYAEKIGTGDFYTKTKLDAIRARGTHAKERSYDLPMARDQITAELVSKRLYDSNSSPKFESGVTTVLNNLAIEVGDNITTETPIYVNGVLDKGVVVKRTLEWGSAIDQKPDLIHLTIKENHTGDGFYLQGSTLTDSVAIADGTPTLTLNDSNTLFQTLTDSISISDAIDVNPVQQLTDSLSISESLAFNYYVSLDDSMSIDDAVLRFTGILFYDVPISESFSISDSASVGLRDSVFESGVFVETDLTTVGVFQ